MREFVLKGSYYEMGRQYGQYCRKDIKLFTKAIQNLSPKRLRVHRTGLIFMIGRPHDRSGCPVRYPQLQQIL